MRRYYAQENKLQPYQEFRSDPEAKLLMKNLTYCNARLQTGKAVEQKCRRSNFQNLT